MNIVIVGNGKVGFSLAEQLIQENHNVTIVDLAEDTLHRASDVLDAMVVRGNAVSPSTLLEAGANSADLLIATTNSDEVNMVCCLTAKNIGTARTIARIRNPEYANNLDELRHNLKIDQIINPESTTANEIAQLLRFPAATNIQSFCLGRVELMGFRLQEGDFLVGNPLYALSSQVKKLALLFCAAERGTEILIPNGSFVPQAGDMLYLIGQPNSLDQFFRLLGRYTSATKRIFLLGGGKISLYLLEHLSQMGTNVKLVELDRTRCRQIKEKYPKITVLCGNGTDQELLESEQFVSSDAFIALTDRDEDNVLISLYAMQQGIPKVITKCNRDNYTAIARSVGLDSVLSAKFITTSHILHLVRGMQNSQGSVMNSLHRIAGGKAEAMEFTVAPNTRNLGVPLKDLPLRRGILIAVIVRDQEVIIPEGSSSLQVNDRVILISRNSGILDLNDIYNREDNPSEPAGGTR